MDADVAAVFRAFPFHGLSEEEGALTYTVPGRRRAFAETLLALALLRCRKLNLGRYPSLRVSVMFNFMAELRRQRGRYLAAQPDFFDHVERAGRYIFQDALAPATPLRLFSGLAQPSATFVELGAIISQAAREGGGAMDALLARTEAAWDADRFFSPSSLVLLARHGREEALRQLASKAGGKRSHAALSDDEEKGGDR